MFQRIVIASKKTTREFFEEKYGSQYRAVLSRFELELQTVEDSHARHHRNLKRLVAGFEGLGLTPTVFLKRAYRAGSFDDADLVVSYGGDGEMLDVARYIRGSQLVVGVRSDTRSRGHLLEDPALSYEEIAERLIAGRFRTEEWTRVLGRVDNGDRIIEDRALNEVYVGDTYSTGMARYTIHFNDLDEAQRSSGVLVATGTGSTGWYANVLQQHEGQFGYGESFSRESLQLKFVVRDPVQVARCQLTHGTITPTDSFSIKSRMNSDGIVSFDASKVTYENARAYAFNRGAVVTFSFDDRPLRVLRLSK